MNNIERRLRILEEKRNPPEELVVSGLALATHKVPWKRMQSLAAGERMVVDWYRHSGALSRGRERITTDPADKGRHCKRGGYLVDVIQELHQVCRNRELEGSCFDCRGTPVAESRPSQSEEAPDDHAAP
jgi:hypothetical protein